MKKIILPYLMGFIAVFPLFAGSQSTSDSLLINAGLSSCVDYALKHQPLVQQSGIDEQITQNTIKSKLADWYPQVSGSYNLQHYFQLPTAFTPDANGNKRPVKTGSLNSSNVGLFASQNIFNRDVLLATRTVGDVLQQARQHTSATKIDVAVEVSKAFYDILLTQRQVQVLDENIVRLQRSLQDAYDKYKGGIVDKIDYKRARISLNNTQADRKRIAETIGAKLAYLKQLMGYPAEHPLTIQYDSLQMESDVPMDTLQRVQLNNRIEYQLLQTQQNLLKANLKYYRWGYLPSIAAVGSYTPSFQNDRFFDLYGQVYPSSYIGLQLSIPIFQGGKRIQNVHNAELQIQRLQLDMASLNDEVNTQYTQALAAYKGNLAEWKALRENLVLAEDVYNTLQLQYNAGIKTYLDVIIAETDLRSAQLNYLNALNAVLSSKLDLQRALGNIQY